MSNQILKTQRLFLKNLEPTDVSVIFDYRNNEACNKYQRWDAFLEADILSFIQRHEQDVFLAEKEEQHFAICLNNMGETVGELACFYTAGDCITLGITISYRYHRKGFAYELLSEVIERCRDKYPSLDIVALIEKGNISSMKLFKKLGFREECFAEPIASYVYILSQ